MKWVSNLPDSEHTPFPFIKDEVHLKTIVRYLRPSDYGMWAAITIAPSLALYTWERITPAAKKKQLSYALLGLIPSSFAIGFALVAKQTYYRFWGWNENSREVELWNQESDKVRDTRFQNVNW